MMIAADAVASAVWGISPAVLAVAITVIINVLAIGLFAGRMVTKMEALAETLKEHSRCTAATNLDHATQLREHSHRVTRLETKVFG